MADELRPLFEAIDRYIQLTDKALDDMQCNEEVLRQHADAENDIGHAMTALVSTDDEGRFPWERES